MGRGRRCGRKRPIRAALSISLCATLISAAATAERKKDKILPAQNVKDAIRVAWAGSSRADDPYPLLHVHFCRGCPDPAAEGSLVSSLAPCHGLRDFKVAGDVVYAIPNDCRSDLLNADEMSGKIAMVHRGEVPIVEKVLRVQAAGARGILVVDFEQEDGGCDEGFEFCGRLGGVRDGGFAKRDGAHTWTAVKIPAILLSARQGERLRRLMQNLERIVVEGYGEQLVER